MDATWTIPKNIRQIGETNAHYGIYIEDYVSTYIGQFAREMDGAFGQGILLGKVYPGEDKTIYVVQGIVTDMESYDARDKLFSEESLSALQQQREQYFEGMDIIGEVVFDCEKRRIDTVWLKQFAEKIGVRHLFLHVDYTDRALAFFIGSQGAIEIVESYYIYYDQNEAMQTYLIAYNEEAHRKVEELHDVISGQARAAMEAAHRPRYRIQKDAMLFCAACALLICVSLLGIVNINQYQKMCKLEKTLDRAMAFLGSNKEQDIPVSGDGIYDDGNGDLAQSGDASGQNDPFANLPIYVSDTTQPDSQNGNDLAGAGNGNQPGDGAGAGNGNQSGDGAGAENANQPGNGAGAENANQPGDGTGVGNTNQSGNGAGAGNANQSGDSAGAGNTNQSGEGAGSGNTDQLPEGGGKGNANQTGNSAGDGQADLSGGESDPQGNASAQGDSQASGENSPQEDAPAMTTYREYIVQRGDTLTAISLHFYQNRGMIREICELNGIENPDKIKDGQKILLP